LIYSQQIGLQRKTGRLERGNGAKQNNNDISIFCEAGHGFNTWSALCLGAIQVAETYWSKYPMLFAVMKTRKTWDCVRWYLFGGTRFRAEIIPYTERNQGILEEIQEKQPALVSFSLIFQFPSEKVGD